MKVSQLNLNLLFYLIIFILNEIFFNELFRTFQLKNNIQLKPKIKINPPSSFNLL